jgi:hypothetical protein
MEECPAGSMTWISTPFVFANRLIGVSHIRYLIGCKIKQPVEFDMTPDLWIYRNLPYGTGDPVAFIHTGKLLVLADGTQLMSFDSTNGKPNWVTGLSSIPMNNPALQTCTSGDNVFATSQGLLQAISISDGHVQFSEYLGDTTTQWRTVIVWEGKRSSDASPLTRSTDSWSLVGAWPLSPAATNRRFHSIRISDAHTGKLVQQIQTDSSPKEITVDETGHGLIWTENSLTGIRFSDPPQTTGSSSNPDRASR